MAAIHQLRNRSLALVFGLVMVGSAAVGTHGPAVVTAAAAAIAVVLGMALGPIATLAVLLAVSTIVLSDPPHLLAALSGLCAAGYLTFRYGSPVIESRATLVGAVGFTFAGIVATSFPLQLPWLPLVAPLAVLAIYVVAIRAYISAQVHK
jgi:hypothetical protein